jgi:hypothetical protein
MKAAIYMLCSLLQPMKAHPEYVAAMLAHYDYEEYVIMRMQGPGCAVKVGNGQSLSSIGHQEETGLLY